MATNALMEKLRGGRIVLGLGNMYPASGIIEGMCRGWDFVWIDGQHGEIGYDAALHAAQAAGAVGVDSLIRVPGHEQCHLGMYADIGPSAIMAPMVDTAEQAAQIVRGLRFPPLGDRSYGGRRIIDLYGRDSYKEWELLAVAQIETPRAVQNAAEIIAVEGIDCLFFGGDDMKLRMGLPMDTSVTDSEEIRKAMARTADAARRAGKFAGCVAPSAEIATMAVQMGYQMLVGGADVAFLRTGASQRLSELRGAIDRLATKPATSGGAAY